jgi:hypothetical protein
MAAPDDLPPDVAQFVQNTLRSIAQLELLVMLIDSSDRWWDAVSAGRALGIDSAQMQRALEFLATRNLLAVNLGSTISYRFEPGSEVLRTTSEAVAAMYRKNPRALLRTVASSQDRAIRDFSDAFRIRPKQ